MEEDEQTGLTVEFNNPVAMYFWRAKSLALREPEFFEVCDEIRDHYRTELRNTYDVLYDRIMATDISPCLKQEAEQWYDFNKDFLGFMRTSDLNQELEGMLNRFNLI